VAITITERVPLADPTDATSYVTGSFSPAANSFLVAVYFTRHNTTAPAQTVSDSGGNTWNEDIPEQVDGISTIGAWTCQLGASPGSINVTFTNDGGITAIGAGRSILEVSGHDPSGTVVATYLAATGLTGTASSGITMSALGNANNAQIAWWIHRANESQSVEAGWTAGTSTGMNMTGPNMGCRAQWLIAGSDLTPGQTWTTSSRYQGLALEIKAAAAGGGGYTGLWVPGMHRNHIGSMQTQGRA